MGYRSQVAWGVRITKNHESDSHLMQQLSANEINLDDLWNMFVTEARIKAPKAMSQITLNMKQRYMVFQHEDLKWYSDFEDVQHHDIIMNMAEEYNSRYEKDFNLPELFDMAFVRIGEDPEDVEEKHVGEGYDMFYTVSVIEGSFYDLYKGNIND